jgi:hypothetical protein
MYIPASFIVIAIVLGPGTAMAWLFRFLPALEVRLVQPAILAGAASCSYVPGFTDPGARSLLSMHPASIAYRPANPCSFCF